MQYSISPTFVFVLIKYKGLICPNNILRLKAYLINNCWIPKDSFILIARLDRQALIKSIDQLIWLFNYLIYTS